MAGGVAYGRRWGRLQRWPKVLLGSGLAVALASLGAACGASPDTNAPTLNVVTTAWPLAQMVSLIGGAKVAVTDLRLRASTPARRR